MIGALIGIIIFLLLLLVVIFSCLKVAGDSDEKIYELLDKEDNDDEC